MTSHHDVAVRLRDLARDCVKMEDLHDAAFFNGAAEALESQAKALSEAERERDDIQADYYERGKMIVALTNERAEMRARLAEAMKVIERDMEALTEADTQIEYLHASGASAIERIDIALTAARAFTNAAKEKT